MLFTQTADPKTGSAQSRVRQCLFIFSLAFNIGFCVYLAYHWLVPVSPYRTPEERMQNYLQYLPENARPDYRERINAKLVPLLEMHKQVHAERQAIVDILAKDQIDKAELNRHFETIRATTQKINAIYQEALVDVEAGMPRDERMKTQSIIAGFLKRDQSSGQ